MKSINLQWYFDPISPFVYLQWNDLARLPGGIEITLRPVLFAGILNYWKSKGPAEIPEKRRFTYRFAQWTASQRGIPFRMPPVHPFNPLLALRLCVALGPTREVVDTLLRFIWGEGRDPSEPEEWRELCNRLRVGDGDGLVQDEGVKRRLRDGTEQACRAGVFGVPTFVAGGEIFWGQDATGMLLDFLAEPNMFEQGEMRRASNVPTGVHRRV